MPSIIRTGVYRFAYMFLNVIDITMMFWRYFIVWYFQGNYFMTHPVLVLS